MISNFLPVTILFLEHRKSQLNAKLCDEKHDVIVIDRDRQPLAEVESQLDILTVQGQGSRANHRHTDDRPAAQLHNGSLAKLALDLGNGGINRLLFVG